LVWQRKRRVGVHLANELHEVVMGDHVSDTQVFRRNLIYGVTSASNDNTRRRNL
jgi:hypothetical protein